MCGFLFSCSLQSIPTHSLSLLDLISKRGPDDLRTIQRTIHSPVHNSREQAKPVFHFNLAASVLSLRGDTIVGQPLSDEQSGSIFVWNGETWKLGGQPVPGNDTAFVFRAMLTKCADRVAMCDTEEGITKAVAGAVRDMLQAVDGPFSFLFFHGPTGLVFYGRDVLGRRSLLVSQDQTGNLHISSVSAGPNPAPWREVETGGIFLLETSLGSADEMEFLDQKDKSLTFKSQSVPWLVSEV